MKKEFEIPEIEVVVFATEDVLADASGFGEDGDNEGGWG